MAKAPSGPGANRQVRLRRAWIVTLVLAIALVAALATVFTAASSNRRVNAATQKLHFSDQAIRNANDAKSRIDLVVVLAAIQREYGFDAGTLGEEATDQANKALVALDQAITEYGQVQMAPTPQLQAAAVEYLEAGHATLALIASGESEAAQEMAVAELAPPYEALVSQLLVEQREEFEIINKADSRDAKVANGALILMMGVVPLAVIVVYHEVVSRQQRQAELGVRLEAERQLSKSREDFLANASHELRTPLTSIYGLSQILEQDDSIAGESREMVEMITTEAADLNRMVDDLLTTARLASGQLRFEPEHIAVNDELEVMVGPFIRGGIDIETDVEPATVNVDRLRQRQLLRNLISNARKYGGPHLSLRGKTSPPWYIWTVADDGSGVPPELESRLFQRFIHQLNFQQPVAGGVGLGLSIVKSLAEGMGGSVRYERVGNETRFIVRLPLAAPEVAPAMVDGSPSARQIGALKRLRGAA